MLTRFMAYKASGNLKWHHSRMAIMQTKYTDETVCRAVKFSLSDVRRSENVRPSKHNNCLAGMPRVAVDDKYKLPLTDS